jgi:phosphocarrier protein HPr
MVEPAKTLARSLRIINELGLHARAAAKIAKLVANANAGVWITKNGDRVDASSVIDILTLSCAKDAQIAIAIDDPEDLEILNALETMVENGFGE